MSLFVLDTGILVGYIRGAGYAEYVERKFQASQPTNMAVVSIVSKGELYSNQEANMRALRTIFVLFLLCVVAISTLAQQHKDDSLFLAGMDLKLGMFRDSVIKGIKGQYSLRLNTDDPNSYWVMEKSFVSGEFSMVGSIKFIGNRLTFASKTWTEKCKDIVEALHAILSKSRASDEGYVWLRTERLREPDASSIGITIAIGKRRISVSSSVLKDVGQLISVSEAIGAKDIP